MSMIKITSWNVEYLFFDLLSNIQGDVFFASRFLNHALFDFPDHLRWSVYFKDFVDPVRDPHILLDHILFTQGLVDGKLPWQINAHAGKVEHEIHDLINHDTTTGILISSFINIFSMSDVDHHYNFLL